MESLTLWRPMAAIRAAVLLRASVGHFMRDEGLRFLRQLVQLLRFGTHAILMDRLIHWRTHARTLRGVFRSKDCHLCSISRPKCFAAESAGTEFTSLQTVLAETTAESY
jgi:hypothetical protein